jgi:beta-lactamase regulating signal transducer with metallopeptidase domain
MNDRLAFRALVTVASLLLFCLGCLLTLPFRMMSLVSSLWMICCILMPGMIMPLSPPGWLTSGVAILAGSLLSVVVVNGAWTVWQLYRATRQLLQATQTPCLPQPSVAQLAARLNLADTLIVIASQTPFSFCYGFWQPRIGISSGLIDLLTETELEAVLRHEAYHLYRREPLRIAIAVGLSRLLFFAPLIAELRDRYLVEKELAADAEAITATSRQALAGAMHKLISAKNQWAFSPLVAVAGLSVTTQRVDRLIDPSSRPSWTVSPRSVAITLVVFVISCLSMLTLI